MAEFDDCYGQLKEKIGDMEITPQTIIKVLRFSIEVVEASSVKGKAQKELVEKLVTKSVKNAPITEEKRTLLLSMIDEGIVGDVIDLVVSATKGELDVNAVEKAAVSCCLGFLKNRQNQTKSKAKFDRQMKDNCP